MLIFGTNHTVKYRRKNEVFIDNGSSFADFFGMQRKRVQ